jgi:hypothetical protein
MTPVLSAAVLAAALVSPPPQAPQDSLTCAATASNDSLPPASVLERANIRSGTGFHGNGQVWTWLWPDGTVVFKKGGVGQLLADGTLRMKFLWLLAGDGPLTIEGRRLDAAAPPLGALITEGFVGRGFQPSSLLFPTTGCWEVTAKANGSVLTFVTRVVTDGY